MTNQTSLEAQVNQIEKGFQRLGREIQDQARTDSALRDSIFYEQIKDLPQYKSEAKKLKAKWGKGIGQDANGLYRTTPQSENWDNLYLFQEAAKELELKYRFIPPMLYISNVQVHINSESVLFCGLGKSARIETYSITKEQIITALKETI